MSDERTDQKAPNESEATAAGDAAPRAPRGGGGVLLPVLLIGLGGVFLAANLGVLPAISWARLAALWPMLLILVGVDLAIGRRMPFAAVTIDVIAIAAAVALVMTQPQLTVSGFRLGAGGSGPGADRVSVPRGSAMTLDLRVAGGTAAYRLSGGATALVDTSADQPILRFTDSRSGSGAASVRIDQVDTALGAPRASVDIKVASDVPLTLRFDAGAGEFMLDLSDVRARDVRVSFGAADVRLILPKPQGDVPVRISAGASSITVETPAGVEARVNSNGGLTSFHLENARYGGGGSDVTTSGYAGAPDRVTVTVTAGASNVTLR